MPDGFLKDESPAARPEGEEVARRCPRDRQPLQLQVLEGVPVDVCRECDGVWLDPGEIHDVAPDAWSSELLVPPRSSLVPHAALPCPRCRRGALIPHAYPLDGRRVEVGVCDRCEGLWLDAGWMRRMAGRRLELESEARHQEVEPQEQRVGAGISLPRHPREWFVAFTGIPIELDNPCRIVPWVTLAIAGLCIAAFVGQVATESGALVEALGLLPTAVDRGEFYRLITAVFLHGDLGHLAVNLLFLYTFGDNIEERYGPLRYLVLFVCCGVLGSAASLAWGPPGAEHVPRIGASGAISGLLGAYLVTFPGTRIVMAVPFVRFLPIVIRWRVWAFLGIWVVLNGIGLHVQAARDVFAVDYLAHLGGFSAGLIGGGILVLARDASLVRAEA